MPRTQTRWTADFSERWMEVKAALVVRKARVMVMVLLLLLLLYKELVVILTVPEPASALA